MYVQSKLWFTIIYLKIFINQTFANRHTKLYIENWIYLNKRRKGKDKNNSYFYILRTIYMYILQFSSCTFSVDDSSAITSKVKKCKSTMTRHAQIIHWEIWNRKISQLVVLKSLKQNSAASTESTSPHILPGRTKPIHFFRLFFSDELVTEIVDRTKPYARKSNEARMYQTNQFRTIAIAKPQMLTFVEVVLKMGLIKLHEIKHY